jgi:hypothetical protein
MTGKNAGIQARLHSRYNPQAEAERYIEALGLNSGIEYFILIEPGLGYLIPALKNRFKHSKIIALHAGCDFNTAQTHNIPAWQPGGSATVMEFLEKEIPDVKAEKLRIIEWRPGLDVYSEAYVKLVSQTVEFIKRIDAGQRTTAAFGRKWVKNFFRNLFLLQKALLYRITDAPVIVVGAGPGLESALPKILEMRDNALVIAASSSFMALENSGIIPDLIISTDGGAWALQHLYPCFRQANNFKGFGISLYASLPSQCTNYPFLVLNEGSLWQSIVLKELDIPSVIVPQRGTVTASALELALILSTGNIYLAGMDLSIKDIRTHVRPYGFDHLFSGSSSRFLPVYSQSFVRSCGIRNGGSHEIYASWFKNQLKSWPKRIFSLGGNHSVFENELSITHGNLRVKDKDICFKAVSVKTDRSASRAAALIRSLEDPRFSEKLKAELASLLFPGEEKVSNGKLREAIEDIAGLE